MVLALIFSPFQNLLYKFHCQLLSRIKINQNVPSVLINTLFYLGDFGLQKLEIKQFLEVVNIFIPSYNMDLLTNHLIIESLEYL